MTNLIIEIGNEVQKEKIRDEFQNLFSEIEKCAQFLDKDIKEIFFPIDFEKKVNDLIGNNSFTSQKGSDDHTLYVQGKIIDNDDNSTSIVFSSSLFSEFNDSSTRYFTYSHEIAHVINKKSLPIIAYKGDSTSAYLSSLYNMYNEYSADTFAYKISDIFFPLKSEIWNHQIQTQLNGFYSVITADCYYDKLRSEIFNFRIFNPEVDKFLKNINPVFDLIALSTTHMYSMLDHYPTIDKEFIDFNSHFLGKKTENIMRFLKTKNGEYESRLDDGIDIIKDYLTIFGFRFEDISTGLYCHVLDI